MYLNTGKYGRVNEVQGILLFFSQTNTTKPRQVITAFKPKISNTSAAFTDTNSVFNQQRLFQICGNINK